MRDGCFRRLPRCLRLEMLFNVWWEDLRKAVTADSTHTGLWFVQLSTKGWGLHSVFLPWCPSLAFTLTLSECPAMSGGGGVQMTGALSFSFSENQINVNVYRPANTNLVNLPISVQHFVACQSVIFIKELFLHDKIFRSCLVRSLFRFCSHVSPCSSNTPGFCSKINPSSSYHAVSCVETHGDLPE